MGEVEDRARVVAVARTWLRTPYVHRGKLKGSGCDCLTLLAEVYEEVGLIPHIEIPHYSGQFMLHSGEEQYLNGLLRYAREVEAPPLPGDIALWRFGRCFSHAAIVVSWPTVIHAYVGRVVSLENAEAAHWLTHIGENTSEKGKVRPRRFFSYWGA